VEPGSGSNVEPGSEAGQEGAGEAGTEGSECPTDEAANGSGAAANGQDEGSESQPSSGDPGQCGEVLDAAQDTAELATSMPNGKPCSGRLPCWQPNGAGPGTSPGA
jgi:hypothetical protein